MSGGIGIGDGKPVVKLILQRVDSAKLLIDNENEWKSIGKGLIAYICFLSGAQPSSHSKIG